MKNEIVLKGNWQIVQVTTHSPSMIVRSQKNYLSERFFFCTLLVVLKIGTNFDQKCKRIVSKGNWQITQVTTNFSSIIVRSQKIFQSDSFFWTGGFKIETNVKNIYLQHKKVWRQQGLAS